MRYALSWAISAFQTEKADVKLLIPLLSNLFIRTAKSVNKAMIGIEALEH